MLSTELDWFIAALMVILAVIVVAIGVAQRQLREDVEDWCKKVVESDSGPLTRTEIAELVTTVAELSDSYDALLKSNRKLTARINARSKRAGNSNDSEVDLTSDAGRTAFKTQLRADLKAKGLL